MINPRHTQQSFLSTRVALAFGLLLSGAFGLAAAIYIKPGTLEIRPQSEATRSEPSMPVPLEIHKNSPAPSSQPGTMVSTAPAPADELIRFCSRHVTQSRSFVIFRYGSCVVVNEPVDDPLEEAKRILRANNDPEARFIPELTKEGNLIISFKEPVFHNFTARERSAMLEELTHLTPALLTPHERVSAGDAWVPPTQARFGLLARRRLLEDAAKPVPVKVIRAANAVAALD